ncbi:MAG: 3-phosphoshikimate 1-carboxyvinyltransferase [Clostridia bacterium]|nr:3-phosphoshikimate 1-carboxyvinyltransferase [Clostridia bacterium]
MNVRLTPRALGGCVEAPASKSFAHRYIVAAMLSDNKTRININAYSDDILKTLSCVDALGGEYSRAGSSVTVSPIHAFAENALIDCGESGTTARIMLPVCAAAAKSAVISGSGRLPERPFSEIVRVLREGGASLSSDKLPISVCGGLKSGDYEIEGHISSQYITGLMFALSTLDSGSRIVLKTPLQSAAYVEMTRDVLKEFGIDIQKKSYGYDVPAGKLRTPGEVFVEGDWSNSAFWIVASALGNEVKVEGLNYSSVQGDRKITKLLDKDKIDVSEIPDLFPVLAVLAAGRHGDTMLYNAARLRLKESDRIEATDCLIRSLGGKTSKGEDFLVIHGSGSLSGGTVHGFNDHRIVMSAAVAASICSDAVEIVGAEAVNKSYPLFFEEYKKLGGEVNVI